MERSGVLKGVDLDRLHYEAVRAAAQALAAPVETVFAPEPAAARARAEVVAKVVLPAAVEAAVPAAVEAAVPVAVREVVSEIEKRFLRD
jgi:hypothetical protein